MILIPHEIGPLRSGDVPTCYADAGKASQALNWKAELGVKDMCAGDCDLGVIGASVVAAAVSSSV